MAWYIWRNLKGRYSEVIALLHDQLCKSAVCAYEDERLVGLETLGLDGESHIKTMKTKAMIAPVFRYRDLCVCAILTDCLSETRSD